MNDIQKALVATAKAYYARGTYLQYDDTRAVTGDVVKPPVYRWERHKNSPEDSTRQRTNYTNCAAFCYDVYKAALDLDIINWCTEDMMNDASQHAFRYQVQFNETEEQKKNIRDLYMDMLQPGDIIVNRHVRGGGHAMFYIGDGKIIHSSGGNPCNYNYDNKCDARESYGSIEKMDVSVLFDPEAQRMYTFGTEKNIAIIRPLMKFKDAKPTESAMNRVKYLQEIFVEKLSSHTIGQTADIGEEITFTYYVRNMRDTAADITVCDIVPEHTEYVSGGDSVEDGKISWTFTLAAGEEKYVSYTVRVASDSALYGSFIQSLEGKVCGVDVKCPAVMVGKHLSESKQKQAAEVLESLRGANEQDTALVERAYSLLGEDIRLDSSKDILSSIFVPYKGVSGTHFELAQSGRYIDMLVPIMYGGRYVDSSDRYPLRRRTAGIFTDEIMAGDLLICTEDAKNTSNRLYIFGGINLLEITPDGAKLLYDREMDEVLMGIMGYYKFALIRPAMA